MGDHWFARRMVLLSSLVLSVGVLVVLHPTILESMDVSLLSWTSSMPTWKVPHPLHPQLLLHPPLLDQLLLLHPLLLPHPPLNVPSWLNNLCGTRIPSVMMSSIPLNATMMVVIVAFKGMMVGMTSVLLANAWVWIVTRLSKSLGEMEEGVMENITMLDASLMEVIAARTLIAKNAKMILLLSKLDQLEHIDL